MALFHGGAGREVVTEVLRHRSLLSSRPYVTDAARMADLVVNHGGRRAQRARSFGSSAPVLRAIQFRLQASPTRSGEFLGKPVTGTRPHLAVPSGLGERPLEFMTLPPPECHLLAGLPTWTVHGEYLTADRVAAPKLYTGTHEFAAGFNPQGCELTEDGVV